MASTIYLPNNAFRDIAKGTVDLDSDTIKVALLADTYTYNAAHGVLADVVAHEVAAGAGYTSGGAALANKTVTLNGAVGKFTADPVQWPGLTKTFRFAILYSEKVLDGVTNPIIACVLLDNTPANVVVTAADYSIQWNASGILTFAAA